MKFCSLSAMFFFSIAVSANAIEAPNVSKVSFFAIGDVLVHSALYENCEKDSSQCVFNRFFDAWKADIDSADYACANQETVFVPRSAGYSSYPAFGTPEEVGVAETNAGFNIITHATNHSMDRGAANIDYTLDFWKDKPVFVLGIHSSIEDQNAIRYDVKKGIKFAFLNFTYGLNGHVMPKGRPYLVDMLDSDGVWLKRIREADENAEVVVAFLHTGTEYTYQPTPEARQTVAKAVDAGADIVVCAHPHVLEPFGVLETKKGNRALVFWSLGNYISNQYRLGTVLGSAAKFEVQKTVMENGESYVEVTKASLEGSVTHFDRNGHSAIPLRVYDESKFATHEWKSKIQGFSLKAIKGLYQKILDGYAESGVKKAESALPFRIVPTNRTKK